MYVPAPAAACEVTTAECLNIYLTVCVEVLDRGMGRTPFLDLFKVETPVPANSKRWNLVTFEPTLDRRTGHAQIGCGLLERHQRFRLWRFSISAPSFVAGRIQSATVPDEVLASARL
jgi:hypothetical protein